MELDHGPRPLADASGTLVEPQTIVARCERCIAWVRIEGWSNWSTTHYSMTPFRTATEALEEFPRGTWFAVADVAESN
jgi:hypothetical protein